MHFRWCAALAVLIASCDVSANSESELNSKQHKFHYEYLQNYGNAWIASPNGNYYQFHIGEQSWLMAREFCLSLNSDLITIQSIEQLMWIISHYPPNHSGLPERTIQIGLVANNSNSDYEQQWNWINQMPLNSTFLEWEMILATNKSEPGSRGSCAVFSVDNMIVKAIECEQPADFDQTNRFICERSRSQHVKHERTNNPILGEIEQLINILQNGNKQINNRAHGVTSKNYYSAENIPIPSVLENASAESNGSAVEEGVNEILNGTGRYEYNQTDTALSSNETNADYGDLDKDILKIDADVKAKEKADVDSSSAEADSSKKPCQLQETKSKQQQPEHAQDAIDKNVIQEPKSSIGKTAEAAKSDFKNSSAVAEASNDLQSAELIEQDFAGNSINAEADDNTNNHNNNKESEYCDEDEDAASESQRNERLIKLFKDLQLFLKHKNATALGTFVTNDRTNKSLIARFNEAVAQTTANATLEKLQHRVAEGGLARGPAQDISEELMRELDKAIDKNILQSEDKNSARIEHSDEQAFAVRRLHDQIMKLREKSGEKSEQGQSQDIYEEIKKELEEKLIEHLRKPANASSHNDQSSEEISSNTVEEVSHRNETSVQYYPHEGKQPADKHSRDSKSEMENVSPTTLLNETFKTSKKTSYNMKNNFKIVEPKKPEKSAKPEGGHKNENIVNEIGKAVSDMENILQSAGKEIKQFFARRTRRHT